MRRLLSLAAVLAPRLVAAGFRDLFRRKKGKPTREDAARVAGFPAFAAWFRARDGTVDDRVAAGVHEVRPGVRVRGLVAAADIPAGTLLMRTPAALLIRSPPNPDGRGCGLAARVTQELERGEASDWHAYFAYDDSVSDGLPAEWDREDEPGTAVEELQGLPPEGDTHRQLDWYQESCLGGRDMTELDWRALKMHLTRSTDLGLIPMYDLMNHHNGLANTEQRIEAYGEHGALTVYATIDIPAGEPIYGTLSSAGRDSTVDLFNKYGFVEDYPQLWRWSDTHIVQLSQDNWDHAYDRFGRSCEELPHESGNCLHVEPNHDHHEVLVVSPTLAALLPSERLAQPLGTERRAAADWEEPVAAHHANLRASYAHILAASATTVLGNLNTTIEEDETLLLKENRWYKKAQKKGNVDVNRADALQAIEFRLAFKRALKLTIKVAEGGTFFDDWRVRDRDHFDGSSFSRTLVGSDIPPLKVSGASLERAF